MEAIESTKPPREARARQTDSTRLTVFLLILISFLFTASIVQYSLKYGRLVHVPTYEDSRYVTDGLSRLFDLYDNGPLAALRSYVQQPPASPWATYMAMAGYAMFGINDWAPYACNGVLVMALLLYLAYRLNGSGTWQKGVVILFALLAPMASLAVTEYRPDLACGLVTAIGIIELAGTPLTKLCRRRCLVIGCVFGVALLVKPSVFLGTFVFLAGALAISMVRASLTGHDWQTYQIAARKSAMIIGVAALVSMLYFVVGLKYQVSYFYQNAVSGARNQWAIPGGLEAHLRYYLDGPGGKEVFRSFGIVYVALFVLVVLGFVLIKQRAARIEIGCASAALFLGYFVPTALPNKAYFGNATFAWMLLVYSCVWLAAMLSARELSRTLRFVAMGLAGSTLMLAGVRFQMPPKWGDYGSPYTQSVNRAVADIARVIVERARAGQKKVFLTSVGFHTDLSVSYLLLKEHFDPKTLTITQIPFSDNLSMFVDEINKADIVIATEKGADYMSYPLPCNKVQDEVVALVKSNKEFAEIKRIANPSGKSYYIFGRVKATAPAGAPTVVSVTPQGRSAMRRQVVQVEVSDAGGAAAVQGFMLRIAAEEKDARSCVVYFSGPHGAVAVSKGTGVWSGEVVPGRKGTAEGNECAVDAAASKIETAGQSVRVTLALQFRPRFTGAKSVAVYAVNKSQAATGWVKAGELTIE